MKLLALTLGFVLRRKWRARQARKASTLRGLLRLLPLVLGLARGMARYRR
jgi:hypothetical protein